MITRDILKNAPKAGRRQRLAIIGAGISGMGAAWALADHHDVSLFERRDRLGGHAATKVIDYKGESIAVDTGFIVYNTLNYPLLKAFFEELGVKTMASDMSFALSVDEGALEWSGQSLGTVFAQKSNLFKPSFYRMIRDILRFNKTARQDLQKGLANSLSLGAYLQDKQFSAEFIANYIVPMGGAIWSTPDAYILDFPAKSFLQFFDNHRLIDRDRPQWRTVVNGSQSYVEAFERQFKGTIYKGMDLRAIHRLDDRVILVDQDNSHHSFDQLIMACHTDQALPLLKDLTSPERAMLSAIRYRPNEVWLHCDTALMPRRRKVWSAWNVLTKQEHQGTDHAICVSYSMNRLQNIPNEYPLFVTLNPPQRPNPEKVFYRTTYDHPQYNAKAIEAQNSLAQLQGGRRTWYCGAWTGYGFHEDGLRSGFEVAGGLLLGKG
jgi:predicted NAD/FAD-binding protein